MQLYIQWTTNGACKVINKNKNMYLKCQEAKFKSFGHYSVKFVTSIYYYCMSESKTKQNNHVYQIMRKICLEYTLPYVNRIKITIVLRPSSLNKYRVHSLVFMLYRRLRTAIWLRDRRSKCESKLPVFRYPRSLRWAAGLAPTPWVPELILLLMPPDGG